MERSLAASPTAGDKLSRMIDRIDGLPSIPIVAEKVGQMVNDPRSDARRIAIVMKDDPALTARVLKLVNSPYFAIPGGVSDVARAISFLGFNTLHQLVLTASVFGVLGNRNDENAKALSRHAVAVAAAAEVLAEIIGHPAPAECFTAGLLHDVGKLATLQVAPDAFAKLVTTAEQKGQSLHDVEPELGLPPHEAVGLRLAKRWRFPLALQAAIGQHHAHSLAGRGTTPRNLHATIDVTTLADALCHRKGFGAGDGATPDLPAEVLERLNLTEVIEQTAHDQLRWRIEKSQTLIQILMGG